TIVSDMFTLDNSGDRHVIVAVPVIRNGQVTRVLAARVRTSSLSDTLRQQQGPPDGAVALIGGDFRIIGRTQQEEGTVGTLANKALIEESQRTAEGAFRPLGRDGRPQYSAFSRSSKTGLTTALGLPANQVDGPIRRILWM